jgi:hypothetical protein
MSSSIWCMCQFFSSHDNDGSDDAPADGDDDDDAIEE